MYHLHTLRHMSYVYRSRFSLRDKVTLRLLKLYSYIEDVVEGHRGLDIRLKRLVLQCINGESISPVEERTKI